MTWFYFFSSICHLELTTISDRLLTVWSAGWDYLAIPNHSKIKMGPGQKPDSAQINSLFQQGHPPLTRLSASIARGVQTTANQVQATGSRVLLLSNPRLRSQRLRQCRASNHGERPEGLKPYVATKNITVNSPN